jgi:sugar phosphate isomerase/epimerase
MKLAYSTNAFTRFDLDTALNHVADLGYAGVEILCERPHWYPDDVDDAAIEAVKAVLAKRNLQVSNLNANTANSYFTPLPPENVFEPALTNKNPKTRQIRESITCKAIQMAHKIGAPCVSVTSGHPTPGCLPEQALEYFVESLKRICEFAEQYQVKIGIEYEPGLIVERADEVCEVIHRVGSPLLGVNLDIGHSFLNREQPEQTVQSLAGRIWNVHLEDIKGMKHFHLVPGDGDLPFSRYLTALKQADYRGFLTVELYSFPDKPIAVGRGAFDFLTKLLSELKLNA